MSIPDKKQRDEWRALAKGTMMVSAVGEYTPAEFTDLLDAVDELEIKLAAAKGENERLRGLLNEARDEMQESIDNEGRLASFASLIKRIDALEGKP